jgi:hypothetical protein
MGFSNKFSMEAKAAIAFIIAQILFKIIFEFEGSRIFAESHPMPAFTIIVIFTIVLNLFPLVLLIFGIAPFQNRPYFNGWITLSLIYFSYQAYKSRKESY